MNNQGMKSIIVKNTVIDPLGTGAVLVEVNQRPDLIMEKKLIPFQFFDLFRQGKLHKALTKEKKPQDERTILS